MIGIWLTGYIIGRNHFREPTKMFQNDTIVRLDTIVVEKPVIVERTYNELLYVAVHDTIRIRDSIFIALPMESKTYKGEDYLAVISGYKPSLDRIEVYPKTKVISKMETTTPNLSPWSIGLDIGLDYGWMQQKYITPNIGAEIGYKKMSLGVECGVNMDMYNGVMQGPRLYWQVSAKYRIIGK